MEYRFLGASGFKVSALGFGAGTFGGKGALFNAWGDTDATQADRPLRCAHVVRAARVPDALPPLQGARRIADRSARTARLLYMQAHPLIARVSSSAPTSPARPRETAVSARSCRIPRPTRCRAPA